MKVSATTESGPGHVSPGEHHLLLLWLLFTGVLLFALFVTWQQGFFHMLYETDRSNISMAITLIYILVTIHCARRIQVVSSEHNAARQFDSMIREQAPAIFKHQPDTSSAIWQLQSGSLMEEYIADLRQKLGAHASADETSSRELLEVYSEKLKGPQEIGWFATDIMLKLGLLGTIIGFIMMLSSVANVTDFDVSTMQNILQLMSSGMGTALYTTMTGLVCSMLAAAQYHMLERSTDEILGLMQHLTEVHLVPAFMGARA